MISSLEKQVQSIIDDRQSGSTDLVIQTMQAFKNLVDKEELEGRSLIEQINQAALKLHKSRPDFAVLFDFLNCCLLAVESEPDVEAKPILMNFLDHYEKQLDAQLRETANRFTEVVKWKGSSWLLHSNSGTVLAVMERLKDKEQRPNIYQTESRPGYEGRLQARQLSQWGYHVTFTTDVAFTNYLHDIDAVLFGADAITETHFYNKTGSYLMALAAFEKNIPVWIVADEKKLIPKADYQVNSSDTVNSDVWEQSPLHVRVKNPLFEPVPLLLVERIFLNKGVFSPGDLINLIRAKPIARLLRN